MDINTLRGISTILCMMGFFAVCWWAFSPSQKKRFQEDAKLPFDDEVKEEDDHG